MSMSFFEFREKIAAQSRGASPASPPAGTAPTSAPEPLTVAALTRQIDRAIRDTLPERVLVRGELSNVKPHAASGHLYFTLKDEEACLNCVMWKGDAARLKFKPTDGLEVIAGGSIKVFLPKGSHQLYATSLQPLGQGALELAFQQLCRKLEAEGLFARERKKPLPAYPMRIALVTSSQTAAVQDMLKVLRRYPWIRIGIYHVPVQGDGSAERMAEAIAHLSATHKQSGVELILLARGGGSLEDRWEFNEECLARAIAASKLPVITGIGHEVDTHVADLVADYFAHTPTEAAQVATAHWRTVRDEIDLWSVRLRRTVTQQVSEARRRLAAIERHETFRKPLERVNQMRQLLDERQKSLAFALTDRIHILRQRVSELAERLEAHRPAVVMSRYQGVLGEQAQRLHRAMSVRLRREREGLARVSERLQQRHPRHAVRLYEQKLAAIAARLDCDVRAETRRWRDKVDAMAAHLHAIGPEQVLRRGYSITTLKRGGAVVRSAAQVKAGDKLVTRFADGQIESTADDPNQPGLFE